MRFHANLQPTLAQCFALCALLGNGLLDGSLIIATYGIKQWTQVKQVTPGGMGEFHGD